MALGAVFCANAQGTVERDTTVTVFKPHWYGQLAFGGQETLGEGSFSKLDMLNGQVSVGYNFSSVFGLRLAVNGWTSRGVMDYDGQVSKWKWNYVAPTVDFTLDLVNLLAGWNPNRIFNAGIVAGIGANIAWNNGEAQDVNKALMSKIYAGSDVAPQNALGLIWDGTKARFLGQFGVYGDFNLSSRCKLGVELMANVLPDGYNSKKAHNADWYFNGLVSFKYAFGATSKKVTRKVNCCKEYVDRYVEVPVEKIVEVKVPGEAPKPTELKRDIFFKINKSFANDDEKYKIAEIAKFMEENPNSTVTITGYADKGTGTKAINLRLSEERSQYVADFLMKEYNIPASRIIVKSMGEDMYQPYGEPYMNRVAIAVAK